MADLGGTLEKARLSLTEDAIPPHVAEVVRPLHRHLGFPGGGGGVGGVWVAMLNQRGSIPRKSPFVILDRLLLELLVCASRKERKDPGAVLAEAPTL